MTNLERIAQAISRSFREEGAFWDGKWEDEGMHQAFLSSARAAVEAMKLPLDDNTVASFRLMERAIQTNGTAWREDCVRDWNANLDAILNEKPE